MYTAYDALQAFGERKFWAMDDAHLSAVLQFFMSRRGASALDDTDVRAFKALAGGSRPAATRDDRIAVVPVYGVLTQHPTLFSDLFGMSTYSGISADLAAAAADKSVKNVILHVDSPGGEVFGAAEVAAQVLALREHKNVVAVADPFMASAAYWVASGASKVVSTPSGMVGAIGVYMVHADLTEAYAKEGIKIEVISAGKYKAEGVAGTALTDEARAAMQGQADAYYGMFVDAVAAGRGVSAKEVRAGYGEGRALVAADAKHAHLVGSVEPFSAVVARLTTPKRTRAQASRALDLDAVAVDPKL